MIFGLCLSSEQINYIFKKISKRNEGTKDDPFYLKYNDFMVSIVYMSIFLKISRRNNNRILQSDLDKIDILSMKNLIDFMGLKIPYNKKELEDFINDRRAISAKELLKLKAQVKKEKSEILNNKNSDLTNFLKKRESELINKQKELKEIEIEKKRNLEKEDDINLVKENLIEKEIEIEKPAEKEKVKKIELKPNSDTNPGGNIISKKNKK